MASSRLAQGALNVLGNAYKRDSFTNLPPSITSKLNANLYDIPSHPIYLLRTLIQSHFSRFNAHTASSMGFSPIVTPHDNFDVLAFPKNHPGRATSDSYYLNEAHMLRTHTSVHQVPLFSKPDTDRYLFSADVYRRDEIDASHYPVFHQMEGGCVWDLDKKDALKDAAAEVEEMERALALENIIIEDIPHLSLTNPKQDTHDPAHATLMARHLKLSLNGLILKLFGEGAKNGGEPLRVRWIEAYFPFTSPSFEVEVFFRGKWLEILGSGVVQQSILDTSNVPSKMGWAFGLGLERIAMVLFSIPDIRLFWSQDPRFLAQFEAGSMNTTFKPYSKYPSSIKDVSFWVPKGEVIHENDFCDTIRDVAGDFVEDVKQASTILPIGRRYSSSFE